MEHDTKAYPHPPPQYTAYPQPPPQYPSPLPPQPILQPPVITQQPGNMTKH